MSEHLKEPESWPPIVERMTPAKAIEIIQEHFSLNVVRFDADMIDALRLALVALREQIKKDTLRGRR